MKRCQDCKHYRPETAFDDPAGEYAQCGSPTTGMRFVENARAQRFPIDILLEVCGRRARWFEPKPAEVAVPLPPVTGLTARLNPQVPPKRSPVSPSRAVAAASVPRRSPVSAAAPATPAPSSSTTDDGMSMLPASMLLASRDESPAPASCSRWDAPVRGGGSFDGGGASGNWDSGSSSSSDNYSSSDSGSSSSSFD